MYMRSCLSVKETDQRFHNQVIQWELKENSMRAGREAFCLLMSLTDGAPV